MRVLAPNVGGAFGAKNNPYAEEMLAAALAQGIGQALLEGTAYDAEGQLLTHSWMDYLLPRCTDVPEIEVILSETPTPVNPLGARSVGEAGTIGAPPAVANAVIDALSPVGIEHIDTPLQPQRLWKALRGHPSSSREPDLDHTGTLHTSE